MAVDESTLYTIINQEITRSSLVQEMINFYQLLFEVGDTKVTDFNEGSEIRNLLEAFAVDMYGLMEDQNELAKIVFIETAYGEWLDKHGAMPQINIPRDEGTMAEGYVRFSVPEASETQIIIPEETIITCTDNDLDYATDSDCIIGVGETSVLVAATCTVEGYDGNCPAGTITIISDDYINIPGLEVNNDNSFSGGIDYEEDDAYRERLLAYEQRNDFGSLPYYNDLALEVTGVHDVIFVDATGYTKKIMVNGNIKPTSDILLADVLEQFTLEPNIVLGHSFTVDKPSYLHSKLKVTCTTYAEISEDDIKAVLQALYDGGGPLPGFELEGLSIGETLSRYDVDSTLELFDDMESFTVEVKYYDGTSWDIDWADFVDKTPDEAEVLFLDEVTVIQTVEE